MNNFVHLHTHSMYSIGDSICKIKDLVSRAKELGYKSLALTDHGTMGGCLEFYSECKKQGIQPIIGNEVYVATRGKYDKVSGVDKYYHLVLLVQNEIGFKNLCILTSESYCKDAFYYRPRIDREQLRQHSEGLIALSACMAGHLPRSITRELDFKASFDEDENNDKEIVVDEHREDCKCLKCYPADYFDSPSEVIKWHKDVFGDRYYIELQNHNQESDIMLNRAMYELAKIHNVKTVATGDIHYVHKEDKLAHDLRIIMNKGIIITDEKAKKASYPGDGYHVLSYEEITDRFKDYPDSIENTNEVASRCSFEFKLGDFRLPHIVDVKKEDDFFREEVYKGVYKRFGANPSKDVLDRIEEEIQTICQMCYPSYILMVADVVKKSKEMGIRVGPGRGSAAGSLVSYVLEITNVNSLDYGLSFARFLNKGRTSLPQIDFEEFPIEEWRRSGEKGIS